MFFDVSYNGATGILYVRPRGRAEIVYANESQEAVKVWMDAQVKS